MQRSGVTDIFDPRRLNLPIFFQQMPASEEARRNQRNRIHVDVFVPDDQARSRIDAALAAGGRIAYDAEAPEWWTLADPEGNEVDIAVSAGREELWLTARTGLEESRTSVDDPFSGRQPTSHERMTGLPWDASYHDGPAPWDRGQPQPAIVRVAANGGFAGAVLDAGCGTGENALHVASLGLGVLGVDVAETAIEVARAKAVERGIEAEFAVADAFGSSRWGAGSTRCWTPGCSTRSTPTSGCDTRQASRR